MTRHFLRDDDLSPDELVEVLDLADAIKADPHRHRPLHGPKSVALIFDKPTLRTQLSFSAGVAELGGFPFVLDTKAAAIGERESIADVTRVITRQVAAIVWRTFGQDRIEEMAAHATVPVINALTDQFHPCQILADLQTIREHKGTLAGLTFCYVGDAANNMAHSYLLGGAAAGLHVRIGGPAGYQPDPQIVAAAQRIAAGTGASITVTDDPRRSLRRRGRRRHRHLGVDGAGDRAAEREAPFRPFAVDGSALARAAEDAIVMHCLPAYRGKEIAADVIDGPQSVVWDEAENRLHAQKALLTFLLERAG